jgi:hypothetical protein
LEIFPLALFPQGSLESSVITTVWVGVLVVAFFNLRFGWVLSGLVVPGYLVPLLIAKPWSAAAVVLEGIVTYLIVWLYSEPLARLGRWSSLFGRDRFFALVLVSVAVRLVFDGWLLPAAGELVNERLGLAFDYRNNLHSFGLIVIALIANLFWKPGFGRGLVALLGTVGTTYLIVRYGLMELTNFSIGNLSYMYEDIASSILASPKAYLILLTTAFIASRMNLHYGWEFNGILIPSLLALQWYQPMKILSSFVEAFIILGVASLVLRAPWLARATVEGARKLVLFFNVGFAYKLLLGYGVLSLAPELKTTDAYAFGYLLSTLIAVKIHDKDVAAGLTRATLQTSVTALTAATAVGFALTLLPRGQDWTGAGAEGPTPPVADAPATDILDFVERDKIGLYQPRPPDATAQPLPSEIAAFEAGVGALLEHAEGGDPEPLARGARLLARAGFSISRVAERYLYLAEREPTRGWGLYVLDLRAPGRLAIEVPAPLDERSTLEVGVALFRLLGSRTLAVAGTRRGANGDRSTDVLLNRGTVFHAFHRAVASQDVLQVRGHTPESVREVTGLRPTAQGAAEPPTTLWVRRALPPGLHLPRLRALLGELAIRWDTPPFANRQREDTRSGFAELLLTRSDVRQVLARALPTSAVQVTDGPQRIDGYLTEWLLSGKAGIAGPGTDRYLAPRPEELLYLDEEVLAPLARVLHGSADPASAELAAELRAIASAAAAVHYRVLLYRHRRTGREYVLLFEDDGAAARRHWGTYVFRLGPARGYLVQVPRPLYEINSFEYAAALFERLEARALMIAGTDPRANRDGSADLVQIENLASVFSLASQVSLRESPGEPLLVIHARAFGVREDGPTPGQDALLSFGDGATGRTGLSPLGQRLLDTLEQDGLEVRFVDGGPDTVGYEVGSVPQSLYPSARPPREFAVLWLSPLTRHSYRQQGENQTQAAQFQALGIPTLGVDLQGLLARGPATPNAPVPATLVELMRAYVSSGDVVTLARLQRALRGFALERVLDRDSQQAFLLLRHEDGRPALVANLSPLAPARRIAVSRTSGEAAATIGQYVDSRAGWLVFGEDR